MLWITLVLFMVGEAVAQKESLVACPSYLPLLNIKPQEILGTWYEVGTDNPVKGGSRCVTIEYTLAKDGSLQIKHTEILQKTSKTLITIGTAKPNRFFNNGLFEVTYKSSKNDIEELHQIVDTDRKTWAFVTDCGNFGNKKIARILMRVPNPNQAELDKVYKAADVEKKEFPYTDQKNCPKVSG